MKFYPHWGSHLPILMKIVQMTDGPILELGIGIFSTPLLHWLCFESKRELISYDHSEVYFDRFRHFKNKYHHLFFVEDWDKAEIERSWDVVLVDHNDERRRHEVKRLANWGKYIIVHDTDFKDDPHYRFSEIFPLFKYRYDYKETTPQTSVLSNFVDLRNL